LTGGAAGLVSAALAHVVTTFFDRALGAQGWLQGRFGPPFFLAALFMGLMYGGIGLSQRTLAGFAAFLGIALPLAILERAADLPWVNVFLAVYILSVWGTIAAIGYRQGGYRPAIVSIGGALVAYGLFSLIPFAGGWRPGYVPQLHVIIDGLLTGMGVGLGRVYARRR
jgi:hypothetical protein